MGKTNISWASHSWNPYSWNCNKVSPGCANCYAEALAHRRGGVFAGAPQPREGEGVRRELHNLPAGSVVFVNSMSDTYHEGATLAMIHSIHNAAAYVRPDVTFLCLTKRPERALALSPILAWPENLWIGTSVENSDYLWRLSYLLQVPAAGHFVSIEPLLGPLPSLNAWLTDEDYLTFGHIRLHPIRWVIVGAESGPNRRIFKQDWARQIRNMCVATHTPFLYKQGSAYAPGSDRLLDGREWNESPFHLEKHESVRANFAPTQLELPL